MTLPDGPWGPAVMSDIRRDPLHSSGALSNCTQPKLFDPDDMEDDDLANDSDASDQQRKERPRKPHLKAALAAGWRQKAMRSV